MPSKQAREPLESLGFQFSVTPSHWSNAATTKAYVEHIIQPYVISKIKELKLDIEKQRSILIVDCWHRDKAILNMFETDYPNIKLVFVPGGCTGVAQACDVFIQRPLKHAIMYEFCSWAANDV